MIAPRLADVVAREIEQRMLEGRLKSGDRLPSEREFSVQLGVSRASLREAIQKLRRAACSKAARAAAPSSPTGLIPALAIPGSRYFANIPGVHEDMLEFRHMLEARAAECAAVRATAADRERVRQCLGNA
jgi:GntR family transcriptional repressor for pyruvate dehydrogenase complex